MITSSMQKLLKFYLLNLHYFASFNWNLSGTLYHLVLIKFMTFVRFINYTNFRKMPYYNRFYFIIDYV